MALSISGYVDPGVAIGEVNVPTAVSIQTVPDVLGIVAHGNRSKRSTNEVVQRGKVFEEALTVAGVAPHLATLVNKGDRRISNTTVRRTISGQTITIPDSGVSYPAATIIGIAPGPFDVSTNNAIGIKMDNGQSVTIVITDGVLSVTITGTLIEVSVPMAGGDTSATAAEIASAINEALLAATSLGYGAAYGSVASVATNIVLTSPITTYSSFIKLFNPFANSTLATIGFSVGEADTVLEIDAVYYDASATYEVDYVSTETDVDNLEQVATTIRRVGSFAGVTSYFELTDYLLTGGDIDWSPDTPATIDSLAETFDVSVNNTLNIAFDGKAAINVVLDGMASPPPGYTNPALNTAATAAEIANNINAIISVASGYGPEYAAVAAAAAGVMTLTSPMEGVASSIEIAAASSSDASGIIFGLSSSQLPYQIIGVGARPSVGAFYYTTYDYARPSTDYNKPKRFYSEDQMIQDLTPVSAENMLSTYGQIAFENNAPSIIVSQVDDTTTPGVPSVNEIKAAIDGLEQSSVVTDVVVADTRLATQTYLMAHIENQSSPTEKNFRCGWFGMPADTEVGDKDTPDTFVSRATVTLQVAADSPARGRLFLVAPAGILRTITNEDATETTMTMDSTALACAVAAKHTSFTSPALSLAARTVTGFDIGEDEFPTYIKAERAQLASNGVLVVTFQGGRLELLDPVSTENGGGKVPKFMYRSLAAQKDNVTRAVNQSLDKNLRGIVPEDLADFIFDIKIFISATLTSLIDSGAIGPFRDANGVSRDIDLSKDVQAEQARTDPTKFYFKYFFFLRYPALRFFGEFSIDNPFF